MNERIESEAPFGEPSAGVPVEPVPLLPRTRMIGSMLGAYTSIRRGEGADVAGSRPYQPGDHSRAIDWKASARLSSVSGGDDFIVRERYAHEMPRVVIVCDRRPEMSLYPPHLPWLSKPLAVECIVELIVVSAVNQRGLVGYLDHGGHGTENDSGTPFWRPPRAHAGSWEGNLVEQLQENLRGDFDAPADALDRGLEFLSVVSGAVPIGSFVFVVSDFLEPAARAELGGSGQSRVGRRRGGRPGSRVGAELPADRWRHDSVRRGRRRQPAVRAAAGGRGVGAQGRQPRAPRAPRSGHAGARGGLDPCLQCDRRRGADGVPRLGGSTSDGSGAGPVTPLVRRLLSWTALAVVSGIAAALAFVVAPGWDRGDGGTFGVASIRLTTSVDPQGALIGDQVKARVRVLVDTTRVDPAGVTLASRFAPFGLVETTRSIRQGIGRAAFVEVTYTLQCVTVDCLYAMEQVADGRTIPRPIRLRAGELIARTRAGGTERLAFTWPVVNLRSRLDQETIDQLETRPAAFRRSAVSYSVPPSLLGWIAVGVALALLLVGGWLVAGVVRGKDPVRRLRIPADMTGVDRALALLEHARVAGDVAGERRALERLSVELRREGNGDLSSFARRLAWSKDGPRDKALDSFAEELAEVRDGR